MTRNVKGSDTAAAAVLWGVGVLAAVVVLSPWVYVGLRTVGQVWGWPPLATVGFGTVVERMLLVGVVPWVWWVLWQRGWRSWADYGFGPRWHTGVIPGAVVALGWVVTVLSFELVLGARKWKQEVVWLAVLGVLPTAVVVALVEEWVFRGVLLRLLQRRWAFVWANGLQAVVFAGMHFLSPPGFGSRHEARWSSGMEWLVACGRQFWQTSVLEQPQLWIKFAVLAALGWLLGVSVRQVGHVGWAVGFHAAAVWAMLVVRQWTAAEKGWWLPWIGRVPLESVDVLAVVAGMCLVQWVLYCRKKVR